MATSRKLTVSVLLSVHLLALSQGKIRYCYKCRSRGELGDCKDDFFHNATTADAVRAIDVEPCASGWCGKIIEGQNEDFDTATERMCVHRPPIDAVERCSQTIIDDRPVYMCFCYGSLCNSNTRSHPTLAIIIASLVILKTLSKLQ